MPISLAGTVLWAETENHCQDHPDDEDNNNDERVVIGIGFHGRVPKCGRVEHILLEMHHFMMRIRLALFRILRILPTDTFRNKAPS